MTDSWTETTLGEVIEFYDHKRIPLSTKQRSQRQGKYPYYGASGIIDYIDDYIFDREYLLISEDGANLVERKTPIAFLASGKFWVNNHAHVVRGIPGVADDYFLMSYIQSANILGYITGTAQPKLSQRNLNAIKLSLPPYQIQRKITAILRPYDDLIANNTRRIQILEEMAQTIYRQWFVEFQFPGHENVPMVESELGMIPQGWEVKILGDLCNVVPGYAFKSKDWQDTGVGVVKIKNIKSDNTIDIQDADCISSDILSPKLDKYQLITGDFLIAMTGATAGKVGRLRTKTPMMLNQRVAKFDPIDAYRDYVWCKVSIKETQQDFFRLADGTAQPNMSGSQIENYKIVCPPSSVCNHFSSVVGAMLIQSDNLMLRNINLRQTRDLLLPKLISGELDVSELDINTDSIQPRARENSNPASVDSTVVH